MKSCGFISMSKFLNLYARTAHYEIPQCSSTNYWFSITESCLINTSKLEASDICEVHRKSVLLCSPRTLPAPPAPPDFLQSQRMDNKKWNKYVCAETLDYYERKNAWRCCLILIWIQLFIVYILHHVKQHNEVYLENISKRLQLLKELSWTTGCCSFIPSTWHYNDFWIFLLVIISSNEITASFPPITSFFSLFH